ncbi:MAG: ABC transporter ATP-binding protein [Actinobacteria bacterium]|nr:ABC transporter ATP-binding protein [Actinomycetota bacterium]
MSLVDVRDLRVELSRSGAEVVDGVSLTVERGEVLGLVGESGSGKTTVALSLLGHARPGTRFAGGRVEIDGRSILDLDTDGLRQVRGALVAYVPQDPATALNPALRVGRQLSELLDAHGTGADPARIAAALDEVRLPADVVARFPHQLSGGQQQRVCLAMAFLLRPAAIVLDEPTTGLDVTTQAHVLETVRELCAAHDAAAVYVSHDLAAVGSLAHRVAVLYAGRLVEEGPAGALFARPGHPYTRKLIGALPHVEARRHLEAIPGLVPAPGRRPGGCVFAPRCEHVTDGCKDATPPVRALAPDHRVSCLHALELPARPPSLPLTPHRVVPAETPLLEVRSVSATHGRRRVLEDVSLTLHRGECLALVGESGSGKTTLSRAIAGLHPAWSGEVVLGGEPLARSARARPAETCRRLQYVFQSPSNALNPRRTVGDILRTPLAHFWDLRGPQVDSRLSDLLERVALPDLAADRYPAELSGGERQRVAIARALAAEPDVLVCDEITSALDTSVQAAIVELLDTLRERDGVALLFVTHDLALVRTIAGRVSVLDAGRLVETGETGAVLDAPSHPTTRRLLADTPTLMTTS